MAFHLRTRNRNGFSLTAPKDVCMLLWIAEQKGFLSDRALSLRIKTVPYSRKGMEILLDGQTDCAILVETNVAYLGYLKPKIPIKCIASLETRHADSILLRCAAGENPAPADLHGKTVGFMPRTTSHSFLMRFLNHHGLDKRHIHLKPMSPQVMGNALIRGEIDAASCWLSHTCNAMNAMDELGLAYTQFKNTGFYASEVALATTKPFLVKNAPLLKGFLKALHDAEIWMKTHREDAAPLLAQKLNLPVKQHDTLWQNFRPCLKPVGDEYRENIAILGEWIREKDTQFLGNPLPDYSDFIDNWLFLDVFTPKPV